MTKSFNERLLQPRPRRKAQQRDKCACGKIGKYTDGKMYYCEKCAIAKGLQIVL